MDTRSLSTDIKRNLRQYFMLEKNKNETEVQMMLLNRMSPELRAQIAGEVSGRLCRSVWYLKQCSDKFVSQICENLRITVYAQGEDINLPGYLCLISRGVVARGGVVKGRNKCFGEDFMLGERLRVQLSARALTFVELLLLQHDQWHSLIGHIAPEDFTTIRKFVVRLTVVRGVKVLAQEAMEEFGIDASTKGVFELFGGKRQPSKEVDDIAKNVTGGGQSKEVLQELKRVQNDVADLRVAMSQQTKQNEQIEKMLRSMTEALNGVCHPPGVVAHPKGLPPSTLDTYTTSRPVSHESSRSHSGQPKRKTSSASGRRPSREPPKSGVY